MPRDDRYPETVAEVLDENVRYRPGAIRAVRAFAKARPWRGTIDERRQKFRTLNGALAAAYNVACPQLVFGGDPEADSGSSCYIAALNTIILKGRLSVVTFLHEWGHRLYGSSERQACRWSINLFRRCFPKSFARCRFDGHLLRRREA